MVVGIVGSKVLLDSHLSLSVINPDQYEIHLPSLLERDVTKKRYQTAEEVEIKTEIKTDTETEMIETKEENITDIAAVAVILTVTMMTITTGIATGTTNHLQFHSFF